MTPTEKVLDKLAKLKKAAESEAHLGNTAAAEAFAEAINRLLIQHELSAQDIPSGVQPDEPIIKLQFDHSTYGIKPVSTRVGWQEILAIIVAEAHLCKILVHTRSNHITFVGTHVHTVYAAHAYGVLVSAATRMSKEARDAYWREKRNDPNFIAGNYRAAWLTGFIGRIQQRLAAARAAEVQASGVAQSTALVRLDQALVRAQEFLDQGKYKQSAPVHLQDGCYEGRVAGWKAADAIPLGQKGVETTGTQKRIS